MPKMQDDFQNAVITALEAVMFENWLRFHFISERDEKDGEGEPILFLDIPDRTMEQIGKICAHLLPMAQDLRGKDATFENSQQAVVTFVTGVLGAEMAEKAFASGTFQIRNELFNTWVQMHEAALDAHPLPFDQWRSLFAQWCETDKVKEMALKLASSPDNGTTH